MSGRLGAPAADGGGADRLGGVAHRVERRTLEVALGRPRGARRVPLFDELEQPLVRAQPGRPRLRVGEAVRVGGMPGPLPLACRPDGFQRPHDDLHRLVAAERDQGFVEAPAQLREHDVVVAMLSHLLLDRPQLGQHRLLAVGALGAERGTDGFHPPDGPGQVLDGDVPRLQDEPDHVAGVLVARGVDGGAPHVPPANRDQALGLEDAQRLAQRRLADLELLEQLLQLGQGVAVAQHPAGDPAAQLRRHQLRQAGLAELVANPSAPHWMNWHHGRIMQMITTNSLFGRSCSHGHLVAGVGPKWNREVVVTDAPPHATGRPPSRSRDVTQAWAHGPRFHRHVARPLCLARQSSTEDGLATAPGPKAAPADHGAGDDGSAHRPVSAVAPTRSSATCASVMILPMSSATVGMSWISPTTWPTGRTPVSGCPSIRAARVSIGALGAIIICAQLSSCDRFIANPSRTSERSGVLVRRRKRMALAVARATLSGVRSRSSRSTSGVRTTRWGAPSMARVTTVSVTFCWM